MEDTNNKELIEEMVREAKGAPEPGTMQRGQVIEGEGDTPMITHSLASAKYVYLYNTKTGLRIPCNRNMLRAQLQKKREDGTLRFTTIDPHITRKRGTYKCLLHPDDPNRNHYDDLGFAVCHKKLTSPYQVKRHMGKRHKSEWAAIEEERKDRERQEDRDFQRQLMAKVTEERPPLYISKKDKEKLGEKTE